jgi:hypothetical protein
MIAVFGAGFAFLGVASARMQAAPDARSWQFDVEFHDPQRLRLQLPGEAEETTFWYLLFRVTNNTGADRPFFPTFRLVTDTLQVVEGGASISPRVYDAIAARHRGQMPFLAPPFKATGTLLQGAANARESVVVFRDFDPNANNFSVFFSGFSGAVERAPNPAYDAARGDSDDNPREFLLRRTLSVTYDLPGDAVTRDQARPVRRTREWVMR